MLKSKKVISRSRKSRDKKPSPNKNDMHIIGVRVDRVHREDITDDDKKEIVYIDGKDWKKDQYHFPSKTARWGVKATEEVINVGTVPELRSEKHKPHKRHTKKKVEGGKPIYPYYEGDDENEICRYFSDKDIFELHTRHPFVAKYFLRTNNFVKGSKQHQFRVDLFFALKSIAKNTASMWKSWNLVSRKVGDGDAEKEIINEMVLAQIRDNPLLKNVCEKLDRKIDELS